MNLFEGQMNAVSISTKSSEGLNATYKAANHLFDYKDSNHLALNKFQSRHYSTNFDKNWNGRAE